MAHALSNHTSECRCVLSSKRSTRRCGCVLCVFAKVVQNARTTTARNNGAQKKERTNTHLRKKIQLSHAGKHFHKSICRLLAQPQIVSSFCCQSIGSMLGGLSVYGFRFVLRLPSNLLTAPCCVSMCWAKS